MTTLFENRGDGRFRESFVEIESWNGGQNFKLSGPRFSEGKIHAGTMASELDLHRKVDVYCDGESRLVTRKIEYQTGDDIRIMGRVGRPSLQVVYNFDELVTMEDGTRRLVHSVGWEHYYLTNYNGLKKDYFFPSRDGTVQALQKSGEMVALVVTKGDGITAPFSFREARENEKSDFWGYGDTPMNESGIGSNTLLIPRATTQDFDDAAEKVKQDPRLQIRTRE